MASFKIIKNYNRFLLLVLSGVLLFGREMAGEEKPGIASYTPEEFKNYWYAGKAELTRYRLEQARYGEIHSGDAVLVFVTEDFLPDKQVKYERGSRPGNLLNVLKLNFTRHFYTGIYPYSIMSSVFTPVDTKSAGALKVSSSTQEWCGQTYMQLNRRGDKFEGLFHSYFQAEADRDFELESAFLEDEIWTKIRLNPQSLPAGDINMIPGLQFLRLRHKKAHVEQAAARLSDLKDPQLSEKPLKVYRIEYKNLPRVLEITFESEFPYQIVEWEESTHSGFGKEKWLTTRAVKTHSLWADYWSQNSVADSTYRKMLGL
jgi:hypothetical protein